ncbi:BnaC08g47540D [Brassica napus]|uniref:BnaC08g47540D protein n=1 Tax=Brassica napus TaxID=3708 RepID=A0A078IVM8_BRANA|nr:BnaC08g47540D [Brassica napus]
MGHHHHNHITSSKNKSSTAPELPFEPVCDNANGNSWIYDANQVRYDQSSGLSKSTDLVGKHRSLAPPNKPDMNHNRHHHFDQTNDDISLYRQVLEVKNEEDLCYNNGLSGGPSLFHDAIESSRSFLDIRLSRPLTDTNPSFKPCFKALNLKEHQMASMLGQLATSSPQLDEVFGSWSCGRVLGGYQDHPWVRGPCGQGGSDGIHPKGRKGRLVAVYGERVGMVQVVPIRPPSHACSAGSYWLTFLYKYRPLGSRFGTIFSKGKLCPIRVREKRKKKGIGQNPWPYRLMMATRGKEKDLEKGLSTPERTPKAVVGLDQTRTVARQRNHEDLSRGWMCGIWDSIVSMNT